MKVLLLSRYGRLAPSSRLRSYQYLPYLTAQGVDVTVVPLFRDAYVQQLYASNSKSWSLVIQAYLRRLLTLLNCKRYDVLWIEKELLPNCPAWLEYCLARFKIPYIVDYDDAVFHRYDLYPNSVIRLLLGAKITHVMRRASVVIVGNDYLGSYAKKSGARRIEHLPTVVDLERYPKIAPRNNPVFTIGWIGSPLTAKYLYHLQPALQQFAQGKEVCIKLIGSGGIDLPGINLEILPWSETTEVSNLQQCDVGIMPLLDTPWELGKCGYKLIQYMACSLPTIASSVGANETIVEHGTTGFLTNNLSDWEAALNTLYTDADLRAKMGQAGRIRVEASYSLRAYAPSLLSILKSVWQTQ